MAVAQGLRNTAFACLPESGDEETSLAPFSFCTLINPHDPRGLAPQLIMQEAQGCLGNSKAWLESTVPGESQPHHCLLLVSNQGAAVH